MKPQDIFDTVVTHLYTQGRRAITEGGDCLYLAPDGRRCAVGALLDPDSPACSVVGGVADLTAAHPGDVPEWFAENPDLLRALQLQHDTRDGAAVRANENNYLGRTLEAGLRIVADDCGLVYRAEHYPPAPKDWK